MNESICLGERIANELRGIAVCGQFKNYKWDFNRIARKL